MKKVLVTGAAGFIGFHIVNKLVKETDWQIVGLDNINDYYDVKLKYARLNETGIGKDRIDEISGVFETNSYNNIEGQSKVLQTIQSTKYVNYSFIKLDLTDKLNIRKLFEQEKFDYVIHLAAQAGVRHSLENPEAYIDSNIIGFFNILEGCRLIKVKHLIYASSSSVYGNNKKVPFAENDRVDHPISLYAATKKSNELMAYTYSHLYNIPMTGLRFFTVYGPWGRPDMAYFKFTESILNMQKIDVYNTGNMIRDFTYIDDVIEGIYRTISYIPKSRNELDDEEASDKITSYRLYNIGNSSPVNLNDFISLIEKCVGKTAIKNYLPVQPGDVDLTNSDLSLIKRDLGYQPSISIEEGIKKFVSWFMEYKGEK